LWNIFLTVLAAMNRRLPAHRYLSVADMLAAYLFLRSGRHPGNRWGHAADHLCALYFQVKG
jgi:hypothetical protein